MIQRIQSVLMLLAGGFLALEFALPIATSQATGTGFFADSTYNLLDSNVLLGLAIGGILTCIAAIFLFNNRKLQASVNWLSSLLCIALLAAGYLLVSNDQSGALSGIKLGVGAFLPLVSLVLLVLANRFIKKDENLVKSMDRLR